jgi:glycosyltransferase involved in cell wall biosynthesis
MRIAINTLAMKRELHGVGSYVKNLVSALSKIDQENEYLLFATAENVYHLSGLGNNFQIEFAPASRILRLPWEQSVLPVRLKKRGVDVYHGPTSVAPFVKTCPQVVSIHDMTFHLVPGRHSLHKLVYFRTMIPAMIRQSDMLIAISECTKRDILRFVATDESKIKVVHHGVETRFQPVLEKSQLDRVRERYGLARKFILYVGLIEPRKNLENLVDAYAGSDLCGELDLVLAGNLGWDYSRLLARIRNSGLREKICLPGYIADSDLPALYSLAEIFVYPSVYEGFGLPVLEAMACGAPVVTSAVSSLPEVVGDAAILVDPHDSRALATALQTLWGDDALRRSLSERARLRSQFFTWEHTAADTLEVYRKTAGQ